MHSAPIFTQVFHRILDLNGAGCLSGLFLLVYGSRMGGRVVSMGMKKLTTGLFIMILLSAGQSARSQMMKNQLQVIGELALPVDDYRPGVGGHVKWLTRLGRTSAFTVSVGMIRSTSTGKMGDGDRDRIRIVPFLIGYRQNVVDRVFVEPQAGYGELGGRVNVGSAYAKPSVGAFVWSLGAGYSLRRFDIGIRYGGAHGAENIDAGTWYNHQVKFVGIFAALNFF